MTVEKYLDMKRPDNRAMSRAAQAWRCEGTVERSVWFRKKTFMCGFVFWSTCASCPVCQSRNVVRLAIPNDYKAVYD